MSVNTASDVDFGRKRIAIRRRIYRGQVSTPKSGRERTIPMAPELEPVLRELRASAIGEDSPVLTGLQKRRPMAEVVLARAWGGLREKFGPQGVRPLRLHDFRHTWATLALEAGRNVQGSPTC